MLSLWASAKFFIFYHVYGLNLFMLTCEGTGRRIEVVEDAIHIGICLLGLGAFALIADCVLELERLTTHTISVIKLSCKSCFQFDGPSRTISPSPIFSHSCFLQA